MTNISAKVVADLRNRTGLPMMEVKKALVEASGDENKAIEILKNKGLSKADSKSGRETKSGLIDCYLHDGRIGVMVEVAAETDFVAKNEDFKTFVHDLTLHIASAKPEFVSKDDISTEDLGNIKTEYVEQVKKEGKPENMVEKIVEGKLNKYYSEVCLLNQPFFKDEDKKVEEVLTELIAKIGENIRIVRFTRYELGC